MFAICIESSHWRGMGHFFRALNFIQFLEKKKEKYIIFVNENNEAISILESRNILFECVDLHDYISDWETKLIKKYDVTIWINDRLDTDIAHTYNIKSNDVKLITFDDRGSGAKLADVNVAGLLFKERNNLYGKKVLTGKEYIILNKEVDIHKRKRRAIQNVIVTLGGSDTHGVTLKIVDILKKFVKKATIILGPSFIHHEELRKKTDERFTLKQSVPSLIREFSHYDLAITGGGITSFEANASGLPCIIIANELHEIEIGTYLEGIGSSIFAGYHEDIKIETFEQVFFNRVNIEEMSLKGLEQIDTNAIERIYRMIIK